MNLAGLLLFLPIAAAPPLPDPQKGWIRDGERRCVFDADSAGAPGRCVQYHQLIPHKRKSGPTWNEYRWMWKNSRFEVRYTSRSGMLGISEFTIGDLAYRAVGSTGYTRVQAVSYAPSREELIIGVPGDGYRFSVQGAL